VIDLRSDTATKPTPEMLDAMISAELGDEQAREDPTVNQLQRRAAELLGHEAALFLPTATMSNQIALRVLTTPGTQLIAEERTHILVYEAGGPAVHSGLLTRPLPGVAGRITPQQVRNVVETADEFQPAGIVVLEQTHRSAGGKGAVHAAIARPERRHAFEHGRLHGDPVRAGEFVQAGAVVLVPILARLHAVAAADAFGRVEENAARLAVFQARRGDEIAVLLNQRISGIRRHAPSFQLRTMSNAEMYHLGFRGVNKSSVMLLSNATDPNRRTDQVWFTIRWNDEGAERL